MRIVDGEGRVILERRIDTTAGAIDAAFQHQPTLRVLIESSTESEWVAQRLEAAGHEVVVADPNYVAMYATRTRRIKTDRRDVAALAEACRTGIYRHAHRVSGTQRRCRQALRIRRHFVRMRTQLISVVRSTLRQEGFRLGSGEAETAHARVARLTLPSDVAGVLQPIRAVLTTLDQHIRAADKAVTRAAAADPVVGRLQTVPGVGPVVALTFRATLDTPERFGGDARRATAFVGVVPAEHSSGERQRKGRITKLGSRELRAMLVQASWTIWRSRSAAAQPLREWAHVLGHRRGRRIAIVALARRLVRILFAVWRDGTTFRQSPARADAVLTVT